MAGMIETGWTPVHRVVFRIDTGAIVAIETVWSEEVASASQPESLYRRLESIKQGFTVQVGPLDVLEVYAMPVGAMQVDLATRTLIAVEQRIPEEWAEPAAFSRP